MYLGVNHSADKNLFFQNISIEQENSKNGLRTLCTISDCKEMVYPKMKMLSLCTRPHVVPNLYDFLLSVEHERCCEKCHRVCP